MSFVSAFFNRLIMFEVLREIVVDLLTKYSANVFAHKGIATSERVEARTGHT
jgi:hypothetical protein